MTAGRYLASRLPQIALLVASVLLAGFMLLGTRGRAALSSGALLVASPLLSACSSEDENPVGTWYGVDDEGEYSTLEINEDGTWLYTGSYSGSGEWSETDAMRPTSIMLAMIEEPP